MTRDSGDVGYSPDQQMKMLRHDHTAANDYVVFDADFFQDFQEQSFRRAEEKNCCEVPITTAMDPSQPIGHGWTF